ncbi:glutamine amidotransferase-like class 1 domain-containing protein 3, mitochondrial [Periplaneta americana]|uniref:glutamine amidotransferase-like class 1 domain-containing protein 3, mitochondrial n=1 Tax=Periplaneta americana TaxID=6978 RepID=UPI0037E81CCA
MLRHASFTSARCFRGSIGSVAFYSSQGPKVAVVLSGSGVYDGSEIHEASSVLMHLTRAGAVPQCYAPDIPQMHVINHAKGAPAEGEKRNVLAESARIARGNVLPITELSASSAEAVVFPGGFGAAKNLSDFAVNGSSCKVNSDVERVLKDFRNAKKPIGLCCIAPILAAKVFDKVTITLGKRDDGKGKWPHASAIDAACDMGANVVDKGVNEIAVDDKNLIVTTPAFMYEGQFHEIYDGIGNMVKKVVELIKR